MRRDTNDSGIVRHPGGSHSRFSTLVLSVGLVLLSSLAPTWSQEGSIRWRGFSPAAFQRATTEDRLILLVLDVPWSESAARAEREVWNDPELARVVRESFVPVRERADLRLDLTRRYPAEGWPAISVLLPDGTPLFVPFGEGADGGKAYRRVTSGYQDAATVALSLGQTASYYRERRADAIADSRAQLAQLEDSVRPQPAPIKSEVVWALGNSLRGTYDEEQRYFGGPPRVPRFDLLELMLSLSGEEESPWLDVALAALETLGEKLRDDDGGLYRMALGLGWEEPQRERLLDRNAQFLHLQTLAYRITGDPGLREGALSTARFIVEKLSGEGGAFVAGVCEPCPDGRDTTVLSEWNAEAAAALIRAGAVFRDEAILKRGLAAAEFLRAKRYRRGEGIARAVIDGVAVPEGKLVLDDQVVTVSAFITAYEATGDRAWLEAASDVARVTLSNLRADGKGGLIDTLSIPKGPTTLRFGIYPLEPNSRMIRNLVRLYFLTDDGDYRSAARELIRSFGGASEVGTLYQASFALAAYEFFFPPMTAHVVSATTAEGGDGLRHAALGARFPFCLVRTWDPARDASLLRRARFAVLESPGIYAMYSGERSVRLEDPGGVRALMNELVFRVRPLEDDYRSLFQRVKDRNE